VDKDLSLQSNPFLTRAYRYVVTPSGLYYLLALLVAVLTLYPVGTLVVASFFTGRPGMLGEVTLRGYQELLTIEGLWPVLLNSVIYSSILLCIGLAVALLFAWAVARTDVPFRGVMEVLIPIPFFTPDLLTGLSWVMLANPHNGLLNQWATRYLGYDGILFNIFGWGGLFFHSSFSAIALMFLLLIGFFYTMDPAYEEASVLSGAGKYLTVFTVTLPMMAPGILGASILQFIRGLEAFENPLLFGSPAGIYVFSNEIYRMVNYRFPPQYDTATALCVFLITITFLLIYVQWRVIGPRQFTTVTGKGYRPSRIKLPPAVGWTIFVLFTVYFLLAIVVPTFQIIASSFFKVFGIWNLDHLTLDNWREVLGEQRVMVGLRNTIVYSTLAGVGVVILSGLIGYVRVRTRHWLGRAMELLAWLPWTIPGIVLSLALLWSAAIPPPPFALYGTTSIIVIGFIINALPLGTRTIQSAIMQVGQELEESARVHGASWLRTAGCILVPLLRLGITATFVLVFALSARNLTIPILLYGPGQQTLTIAMLLYIEEGLYTTLSVAAVIQLAIVVGILVLERVTRPRSEE